MKKITFLMALFLSFFGIVSAQVTSLEQLSNSKVYTLQTARGYWMSGDTQLANGGDAVSTDNPTAYQFGLYKAADGNYYLYSVTANSFVVPDGNGEGVYEASTSYPVNFSWQSDGTVVLALGSLTMNFGGSKQVAINSWSDADDGNKITITEAADIDESLMAAVYNSGSTSAVREELAKVIEIANLCLECNGGYSENESLQDAITSNTAEDDDDATAIQNKIDDLKDVITTYNEEAPMKVLSFIDGLPGTSDGSQYTWTSPALYLPEGTSVNTLTVWTYEINTGDTDGSGEYPCVAISELNVTDANDNAISLTAANYSTNAQESSEGPIANICDGDKSTYFHSAWSSAIDNFPYVEIALPEAVEDFKISFTSRNLRTVPTVLVIATDSVARTAWTGKVNAETYNEADVLTSVEGLTDGQKVIFKHKATGEYLYVSPLDSVLYSTFAVTPAEDNDYTGLMVFTAHVADGVVSFESNAFPGNYIPTVNYADQPDLALSSTEATFTLAYDGGFVITSTASYSEDGNLGAFDLATDIHKFVGWQGTGDNCKYEIVPVETVEGNATFKYDYTDLEITADKNIILGDCTVEVEEYEWYVLQNKGRGTYAAGLSMLSTSPSGMTATDGAAYLFQFVPAEEEGTYYLRTSDNNYIYLYKNNDFAKYGVPGLTSGGLAFKVVVKDATDKSVNIQQTYQETGYNLNVNAGAAALVGYQATGPNSTWYIYPAKLGQKATVNYNVYIGEQLYTTVSKDAVLGDPLEEVGDLDYLDVVSYDPALGTEITEGMEVKVVATENLPFQTSTSADAEDAKWYLIDMNNSTYTWKYVSDADDNVQLPQVAKSQTTLPTDEYLWCFTGNLIDGFSIYNKAAGSTMPLCKEADENTAAGLMSTGTHNKFELVPSTAVTDAHCFRPIGHGYYVNGQTVDGVMVLRGWNAADGGSSCRFYPAGQFVLNSAASVLSIPDGAIASYSDDTKAAVVETAGYLTEDPFDLQYAQAVITALAGLQTTDGTVEAYGYYRLVNGSDFNYLTLYQSGSNYIMHDTDAPKAVTSVFQFCPSGESGQYEIKVQGLTLGTILAQNQAVIASADGTGIYQPEKVDPSGLFTIQNMNATYSNPYMHVNNGNLVGWTANPATSRWYIVPATEVEVALQTVGDASYAAVYMPFPVKTSDDVKLYTGLLYESTNSAAYAATLKMFPVEAVPAETGVLVAVDGGSTIIDVDIASEADAVEGNAFTGTLLGAAIETGAAANFYTLTSVDGVLAFNAATTSSVAANNAYLAVTDYTLPVNVDFNIEGISNAKVNDSLFDADAPVFDLSGRRVVKVVKGNLYIQKGNKFIAK